MITLLCYLMCMAIPAGEAEEAYAEGRFGQAFEIYLANLQRSDAPAGEQFYNLGNCAYRLNNHAEAILWYRRAALLLPRDQQVRFNLQLAEQALGITTPPRQSFATAALAMLDNLHPGVLLALAAGLKLAALVCLILHRQRRGVIPVALVILLLGLTLAFRLVQNQLLPGPLTGVVLKRTLPIHPEPDTKTEPIFTMRAGAGFKLEQFSDKWVKVKSAQGSGWGERVGVGVVSAEPDHL